MSVRSEDRQPRLAEEQAALRRVATLVAQGAPAERLFSAVAEEVALVLGIRVVVVERYDGDGATTVVASRNDPEWTVGSRSPLDQPSLAAKVFATGGPTRIEDYSGLPGPAAASARAQAMRSTVGVPIVIDGEPWGVICVGTSGREDLLPADTEVRLAAFTELVATAIVNAQARDDLRGLLEEQAALRHVATLVARGATAKQLFAAVTDEVTRLLGVPAVTLERYEGADDTRVLAAAGDGLGASDVGPSFGVPIVVDGMVWGRIAVTSSRSAPLPADTEARLARFTELVATAVSNAAARSELIASRARIVAAGDEARRRIERNLHDGIQQRLIALTLELETLGARVAKDAPELQTNVRRIGREIESVLEDVRELSRGLHPGLLSRHGLGPSLRMLARRCPLPVALDVDLRPRPPQPIEIGLYYVVSEALTNASRHSHATEVSVSVSADDASLRAVIADDGAGGAQPADGSGLAGLADRVAALGGRFQLDSPPGGGTRIAVEIPLPAPRAARAG